LRYLYSLLFYLALPFIFLRLLWRSRRLSDYRYRWQERLGFCPHRLERCIWLHAVSVGETLAALPLIKKLKEQFPDLPLLITNMTPTGAARVKAAFGNTVLQAYVPYDLPDAVARFLQRVNPKVVVIMETELWPNLFAACQQRDIPIVIANARLSAKSAAGYRRIAPLTRQLLAAVHTVAAQGQADADRFKALGLPEDRVVITGSIKFDVELPIDLEEIAAALRITLGQERIIWIAASTHAGEEEIILAAHKIINQHYPQALLILVPRHPDRFNAIFTLIEQQGFKVVRRSQMLSCTEDTTVFLGDSMGEMFLMYAVSDVCFVAGSLIAIGGHNMLEPAVLAKPIITGPHLFNFAEISQMLLEAGGMLKIENKETLSAAVMQCFADADYRQTLGKKALGVVEANRGSLTKQMNVIKKAFVDSF
jgi:3-deoxy-D-manno-octulosonic-acid transferase